MSGRCSGWIVERALLLNRLVTMWGINKLIKSYSNAGCSPYSPITKRILYVPASCLPYHISGYTTRTHAVIRALQDAGADVRVLTRPGYPWDRGDKRYEAKENQTEVDTVVYRHVHRPHNYWPVLIYAFLAAKKIVEAAGKERVMAIQAASNHVNALPALLAARRLGIPFYYEMRGLWELTRVSRTCGYEGSQAYLQGLGLEALVAAHADSLFVISEQLGSYAQAKWGISAGRMALLPNCIDPANVLPADPALVEKNTIGYAGSLIGYEGLDTLLEATANLVKQGKTIHVRIAGEGEAKRDLEALAQRLGLDRHVQFFGRMEPAKAKEMIARCAIVCIPRKPFQVCEIVPPIKLVEALAMGKPVIVPDLPVFRDEMGLEPAGWFFEAGNADDLARVINAALAQPERLAELGRRAREYAVSQRSWRQYVTPIVESLQGKEPKW